MVWRGSDTPAPAGDVVLATDGRPCSPISIVCLITSLEVGGAEMTLFKLLSGIDRTRFRAQVISLVDLELGPLSEKFQTLGLPLRSLGMRPGRPNPISVLRLARRLWKAQPNIISTWMYHADLVGGLASRLAGCIPVAWGIHNCNLDREGNKWLTLQTVKVCALMSNSLPTRIICSSEASRKLHAAVGYAGAKMIVIPNGSDLAEFRCNPAAHESVRRELQIPEQATLIGMIGRFDPLKDHRNFVQAATLLHRNRPDVHFLLCGDDVTWDNFQLARGIHEGGIAAECRLLGRRDDIPRLTAALDIATSSSFGESFSCVIGEAMSCEVPCVVTDVGDSALIVGQTGRVVPPTNAMALSSAWRELIEIGSEARRQLGIAARRRISEHFNLPDMVRRYENMYEEVANAPGVL
jgi:glycosyltransferase involved in cell wall biosynthesis